jgi:bacillithiol system protein YtxJ
VASAIELVGILKHGRTCGTSAMAEEEVLEFLESGRCAVPVWRVEVWSHRDVSNAVAKRFGVRHETPQVLFVRGGQVVWNASHFRVTAAAIEQKLRELAQPATAR